MLPFENLTGDASLDWIKPAGTMIMNEQLLGSPNLELLRANAVRDAESSGATKIMHGTITRRGTRFHVEARIEDAKTHKIDAALVSDGSLLQALSALSAKIDRKSVV